MTEDDENPFETDWNSTEKNNDADSEEDEVMDAEEYLDEVNELDTAIDNFTAVLSRIEHGHGPWKGEGSRFNDDDDDDGSHYSNHDLRGRFNVTDDFVRSHLYSQTNDHLAVYEMGVREDEFRGREAEIFRDIDENTSQSKINSRWDDIKKFAGLGDSEESAPTPPEAKKRLNKILEIREEEDMEMEEVPQQVRTQPSSGARA